MADSDNPAPEASEEEIERLLTAARQGRLDQVKRLLAAGTSVNSRSVTGDTALTMAVKHGRRAIVQYLVQYNKIDIDGEDHDGHTPLWLAVAGGYVDVVSFLVEKGARLDEPGEYTVIRGKLGMDASDLLWAINLGLVKFELRRILSEVLEDRLVTVLIKIVILYYDDVASLM